MEAGPAEFQLRIHRTTEARFFLDVLALNRLDLLWNIGGTLVVHLIPREAPQHSRKLEKNFHLKITQKIGILG